MAQKRLPTTTTGKSTLRKTRKKRCFMPTTWSFTALELGRSFGYYYPGQKKKKKKEPCCWCIKSESCDIEESRCLIQLRNRERTRLATAVTSCLDASQRNQTADSSISHDASQGWFFFFGQGSIITENFIHVKISHSGFHFFYTELWTAAYKKPMVKKVWKKSEKSRGGLPSSPKSKQGREAFGILPISIIPFFEEFGGGGFSRHVCPVTNGRQENYAG